MKTYSRADWERALQEWDDGAFSDEWRELRHTMAMQGCIFPPAGTAFDSWEDDQPSQRAVLIRALRETPILLRECAREAHTWSQVIDRLFRGRDDWRAELDAEDKPEDDGPTHRQAVMALGAIIKRLEDSQ